MKTINCFSFLIITLLLSCNTAEKWPTKRFIAKNNYQEVIGQVYSHAGKREKPDKFGMYPNGQKGINDLIIKNVIYPAQAKERAVVGQVIIKYDVDIDGFLKAIEVDRSVNPLLDNEAIRVIKLMERWIPAYDKGKAIKISYRQPFNFKLK